MGVIPGRAGGASPESIIPKRGADAQTAQTSPGPWLWVPGSRALRAPRDDSGGYAAFCFAGSSRNARRKIFPTGVFGSSSRNSMIFGRL